MKRAILYRNDYSSIDINDIESVEDGWSDDQSVIIFHQIDGSKLVYKRKYLQGYYLPG